VRRTVRAAGISCFCSSDKRHQLVAKPVKINFSVYGMPGMVTCTYIMYEQFFNILKRDLKMVYI
jgi:hypothetical protein